MSDPRPAGRFLLVDTQSGAASARFHEDGLVLARAGNDVSIVLSADAVEAGVGVLDPRLAAFITAGGRVLVDDFTLAHRGLAGVPPAAGVAYTGMAQVAELLLAPDVRVVWH